MTMAEDTSYWGYEVIQVRKGGAAAGNHLPGITGIRFKSKKNAVIAAARACGPNETWRVVEIPPGEPLDYDGHVVAEVTIGRLM
jgi:hypothetical protein